MQPNEENHSDTNRLLKSVQPCLAGCPSAKVLRKGISPYLIRWFQAWLANLQSWVTFEGVKSKKNILKQGVPLGSVLSPVPLLLLLFYIDDMRWDSRDLHGSVFADDVSIRAQDSKLHIAEKIQQQSLDAVTTWSKG